MTIQYTPESRKVGYINMNRPLGGSSKMFWEAVVRVHADDAKPKTVYVRKCLNETHANKVAADMAARYQHHYATKGERFELRGKKEIADE